MFSSKRQSDNVLSHWYVLMDNFQFSTREFYNEVEKELIARQTPGLKISRVDFHEGSVLTDQRTYLRLARERYAFDVCAAPFGRGYFFSLRFVEKPRHGLLALLAILACLPITFLLWQIMGRSIAWLVAVGIVAYYLYQTLARLADEEERKQNPNAPPRPPIPPFDFNEFLHDLPVFGRWYERLRKETYFRFDTRMMYHTLVTEIVKKKVEEVTAAKGVKLVRSYEYSPILGDLYKTTVTPNLSTDSPRPLPI